MITFTRRNLLEANVDALVNAVNTVGMMGKGIAVMFRKRYRSNYELYVDACRAGQVQTGCMFVTETGELIGPRRVVNFPTKQHWRDRSRLEWVIAGLRDLKRFVIEHGVRSIAIPALGAGNGGLPWPTVRHEIEKALGELRNIKVWVYEPMTDTIVAASRSASGASRYQR